MSNTLLLSIVLRRTGMKLTTEQHMCVFKCVNMPLHALVLPVTSVKLDIKSSVYTCNLSATEIKPFPSIEVLSRTHCFHFSVPHWRFRACPRGQGGVVAGHNEWEGITQHDYSPSVSMFPNYCPCEITGHWQGIGCSLLSLSDSLVGQPAKQQACQQPSHFSTEWPLPALRVWVGATQCFLSCPRHLN